MHPSLAKRELEPQSLWDAFFDALQCPCPISVFDQTATRYADRGLHRTALRCRLLQLQTVLLSSDR